MANATEPVPGNVKHTDAPTPPADTPDEAGNTPPTEEVVPQHGLVGSKDRFTLNELNMYPVQPTVEDSLGVERIIGPALDNWHPAPVDPHPDDIAHGERVAARAAEARERRKEAFTSRHPAAAAVAREANEQSAPKAAAE